LAVRKKDTATQYAQYQYSEAGQRLADPSEHIDFACRQCGGCCTNTTPYVTPWDVWRLARALGTSTSDIITKYLIIIETSLPGVENLGRVPLLALKMTGNSRSRSKQCVFLDRETHRCTVYNARPLSCRMFPAGLQYSEKCQYVMVMVKPLPECSGYGAGHNTLQQYLNGEIHDEDLNCWRQYTDLMVQVFQGNDLAANEDFADSFLAAIFDLDNREGFDPDNRGGNDFCGRFAQGRQLVLGWLD
jgi:Fe-S-cluster containining protein